VIRAVNAKETVTVFGTVDGRVVGKVDLELTP